MLASELNITILIGGGLTLIAAFMWGLYTVSARSLSKRYGALWCTGITTIAGTIPLLALSSVQVPETLSIFTPPVWGAFLFLALGSTCIATMLWNYGVAQLPGAQAGTFLYLLPFVSILGGTIILHEALYANMLMGCLLIVGV